MPRTTLALKFGLYVPALAGPLFLALSFISDGMELSHSGGLNDQLDVAPALLLPAILVLSYLAFGLPAFVTGILAAVFGPSITRWDIYQAACAGAAGTLCGAGYLIFVRLMGAQTEQDRVLAWVAVIAGALTAALLARLTRAEHQEAVKHSLVESQA